MRCGALLFALMLTACAARPATPVPQSQAGDATSSCEEIAAEMARNEAEAARLIGADDGVVAGNVAAGVAGTVFLPALLAIDLSNAEQIQFRALQDRNRTLARLHRERDCQALEGGSEADRHGAD